jgi:hypothetical protein
MRTSSDLEAGECEFAQINGKNAEVEELWREGLRQDTALDLGEPSGSPP